MPKPYRVIKWPNGRRCAIGEQITRKGTVFRYYFLVKITGSNAVIPFYISSGDGGKKDAEGNLFGVDQAFPFFGMAQGITGGWHNKTNFTWEGEDPKYAIDTYYGMPLLKRIAEEIDLVWSKYGHKHRNPPSKDCTPYAEIDNAVNHQLKMTIGITPAHSRYIGSGAAKKPNPLHVPGLLYKNIDVARKRIEGDVMLPMKRPPKKDKPKRLDSTFAIAATEHEPVSEWYSSGEVNRTMYTWNPVLSTRANHQAAEEAGAPRGPCWCGVYHDIRLDCPNREMYQLNKNYYTNQGGNNRARVSN